MQDIQVYGVVSGGALNDLKDWVPAVSTTCHPDLSRSESCVPSVRWVGTILSVYVSWVAIIYIQMYVRCHN